MRRTIRRVGVVVALTLWAGAARGDRVSYSFTGTDTATGTPVVGSFTYQTNTPAILDNPDKTILLDVGGSLTITARGQTYSTTAVGGVLQFNSLVLLSGNQSGPRFAILLASANASTVFPEISFLPPKLNLSNLGGSMFEVGDPHSQTSLAQGPITLLDPVAAAEAAPEPGALTLAGVALASALVWWSRKRPAVAI